MPSWPYWPPFSLWNPPSFHRITASFCFKGNVFLNSCVWFILHEAFPKASSHLHLVLHYQWYIFCSLISCTFQSYVLGWRTENFSSSFEPIMSSSFSPADNLIHFLMEMLINNSSLLFFNVNSQIFELVYESKEKLVAFGLKCWRNSLFFTKQFSYRLSSFFSLFSLTELSLFWGSFMELFEYLPWKVPPTVWPN